MFTRTFSMIKKNTPLIITTPAWNKMTEILSKNKKHAFLFSAKGGGCNGFNYILESISSNNYDNLMMNTPTPIVHTKNNTRLMVEPLSEILLLGTTIDYIEEDYSNDVYESKFVYTPQKDKATTCGCGISFIAEHNHY